MSKKRINSCEKGKVCERQAAHYLASLGFPTEREARNGKRGANDLKCKSLSIHLEVKARQNIDLGTKALGDAMEQAASTTVEQFIPTGFNKPKPYACLWKKNRTSWRLTIHDSMRGHRITLDTDEGIRAELLKYQIQPKATP